MNIQVLLLGLWAIYQVIIAAWALSILENKCDTPSLYTKIRTLLVIGAVTATVLFSSLFCNSKCYDDDDETPKWVAMFVLVMAITSMALNATILSGIDDCAKSSDSFKIAVRYVNLPLTVYPILYGIFKIYRWFSETKQSRSLKQREVTARREAQKAEKDRKEAERLAQKTRKAEELESIAKREKDAKAKVEAENKTKMAQLEKLEQETQRKARGEYTPEELIEIAETRVKMNKIGAAKKDVEIIKQEIVQAKDDDMKIQELGKKLKDAKEKLARAERKEDVPPAMLPSFFG
jgi:hypothetical protein